MKNLLLFSFFYYAHPKQLPYWKNFVRIKVKFLKISLIRNFATIIFLVGRQKLRRFNRPPKKFPLNKVLRTVYAPIHQSTFMSGDNFIDITVTLCF